MANYHLSQDYQQSLVRDYDNNAAHSRAWGMTLSQCETGGAERWITGENRNRNGTTDSGAFQFNNKTAAYLKQKYGLQGDMSDPNFQKLLYMVFIKHEHSGIYKALEAGDFAKAFDISRGPWHSLEGSRGQKVGNNVISRDDFMWGFQQFSNYLGNQVAIPAQRGRQNGVRYRNFGRAFHEGYGYLDGGSGRAPYATNSGGQRVPSANGSAQQLPASAGGYMYNGARNFNMPALTGNLMQDVANWTNQLMQPDAIPGFNALSLSRQGMPDAAAGLIQSVHGGVGVPSVPFMNSPYTPIPQSGAVRIGPNNGVPGVVPQGGYQEGMTGVVPQGPTDGFGSGGTYKGTPTDLAQGGGGTSGVSLAKQATGTNTATGKSPKPAASEQGASANKGAAAQSTQTTNQPQAAQAQGVAPQLARSHTPYGGAVQADPTRPTFRDPMEADAYARLQAAGTTVDPSYGVNPIVANAALEQARSQVREQQWQGFVDALSGLNPAPDMQRAQQARQWMLDHPTEPMENNPYALRENSNALGDWFRGLLRWDTPQTNEAGLANLDPSVAPAASETALAGNPEALAASLGLTAEDLLVPRAPLTGTEFLGDVRPTPTGTAYANLQRGWANEAPALAGSHGQSVPATEVPASAPDNLDDTGRWLWDNFATVDPEEAAVRGLTNAAGAATAIYGASRFMPEAPSVYNPGATGRFGANATTGIPQGAPAGANAPMPSMASGRLNGGVTTGGAPVAPVTGYAQLPQTNYAENLPIIRPQRATPMPGVFQSGVPLVTPPPVEMLGLPQTNYAENLPMARSSRAIPMPGAFQSGAPLVTQPPVEMLGLPQPPPPRVYELPAGRIDPNTLPRIAPPKPIVMGGTWPHTGAPTVSPAPWQNHKALSAGTGNTVENIRAVRGAGGLLSLVPIIIGAYEDSINPNTANLSAREKFDRAAMRAGGVSPDYVPES